MVSNLLSFDVGLARCSVKSGSEDKGQEEEGGAPEAVEEDEEEDGEEVPPPQHGYDVLVRIVRATDLPRHDWWNGRADPYVIMRATPPGDQGEHQYR